MADCGGGCGGGFWQDALGVEDAAAGKSENVGWRHGVYLKVRLIVSFLEVRSSGELVYRNGIVYYLPICCYCGDVMLIIYSKFGSLAYQMGNNQSPSNYGFYLITYSFIVMS